MSPERGAAKTAGGDAGPARVAVDGGLAPGRELPGRHLFAKLHVADRTEAVIRARNAGLAR